MATTETARTLSAKQAAESPDLWLAVQRGEKRVTRLWPGEPGVAGISQQPHGLYIWGGNWQWEAVHEYGAPIEDDLWLSVTDIPVENQSPNSPAAVDRLNARIAALESGLLDLWLTYTHDEVIGLLLGNRIESIIGHDRMKAMLIAKDTPDE